MPTILFTGPHTDEKRVFPYKSAIEKSGGTLLLVPETASKEEIDELISQSDGILLPGGTDVNPKLYGEECKSYCDWIHDSRDALEMQVLGRAIEKEIPTLAICRGLQILNVCRGGTLYQDIKLEMDKSLKHDWHKDDNGNELPRSDIRHSVKVMDGTLLHEIIGADGIGVNSLHHQGIHVLGKGLTVSAVSPDGLIEAIEVIGHPFMLGVQWHPEAMYSDLVWKHLFDVFISKTLNQ